MASNIKRGEMIRRQILRDVVHHPNDIAAHVGQIFSISRQAANKHLKKLTDEGWLTHTGTTKGRVYARGSKRRNDFSVALDGTVSEHDVYLKEVSWVLEGAPDNVEQICFYGFTEMLNNAIDHSQGTVCEMSVERDKGNLTLFIADNGEGIFRRITRLKQLEDERQALLELHKGKLTTDPDNHSGQGIFFTSKMFDTFVIWSHDLRFSHFDRHELDVLSEDKKIHTVSDGTVVLMQIAFDSARTDTEVFEEYSEEDNFAFNRTVIPVGMARFGQENLVSRSQAKRLLTRLESFLYVVFDFEGIDSIGQAFADEIFRVYRIRNPEINISYMNASQRVTVMIKRAEAELKTQ